MRIFPYFFAKQCNGNGDCRGWWSEAPGRLFSPMLGKGDCPIIVLPVSKGRMRPADWHAENSGGRMSV